MKRAFALLIAAAIVFPVFAQRVAPAVYQPAEGTWLMIGDRLHQTDQTKGLAKMNIPAPQYGKVVYDFNVRYEGGAEDGHGGFGIHIFADQAHPKASWGMGKSFLLWLNYDMKPGDPSVPAGFSALVYESLSNSEMKLVAAYDLNKYAYLATPQNLGYIIPAKIVVDGNTGEVKVYDPTDSSYYFYFRIPTLPKSGSWMAIRTNGMKMSFGLPN